MRTVLFGIACLLAGCDATETATSSVVITDQADIVMGESAVVDGVSVTFVAVEEDSRCPIDAMCIREGWALVTLDLDGTRASVRVVDPDRYPEESVRVGDRLVFATALTPRDLQTDIPPDPKVTVATVAAE